VGARSSVSRFRAARRGLGRVRPARSDELRVPRFAEAVLVAGEALHAQVERECALWIQRPDEGENADPRVSELAYVLGSRSRRRTVVDPDEGSRSVPRLVDGHDRQVPHERRLDAGVVPHGRVDDKAVDGRAADGRRGRVAIAGVGEEQQAEAGVLHAAGETAEESRRGGVGELVAQALREESSGIIDGGDVLGRGWFLLDAQVHKAHPDPALVEHGQLLALYVGDFDDVDKISD
jgi:hypothetical protein